MKFYDSTERVPNQVTGSMVSDELLESCRGHLESVQNLRYLVSIDAYDPKQVMQHVRRMDWHLRNLAELLLEPRVTVMRD